MSRRRGPAAPHPGRQGECQAQSSQGKRAWLGKAQCQAVLDELLGTARRRASPERGMVACGACSGAQGRRQGSPAGRRPARAACFAAARAGRPASRQAGTLGPGQASCASLPPPQKNSASTGVAAAAAATQAGVFLAPPTLPHRPAPPSLQEAPAPVRRSRTTTLAGWPAHLSSPGVMQYETPSAQ